MKFAYKIDLNRATQEDATPKPHKHRHDNTALTRLSNVHLGACTFRQH